MRNQDFVRPGMVELAIKHMPGCGCALDTPDPEATLVQLGCVTGYLVERGQPAKPRDLGPQTFGPAPGSDGDTRDWYEGGDGRG